MLILNLTRGDSGIRVPLHLPATPADVGDVYAKLDQIPSPEETAVHSDEINRLCAALKRLNPDEYALIYALFFEGISEREYAARIGSHYMTIHNRKVKIQEKLKKILERSDNSLYPILARCPL